WTWSAGSVAGAASAVNRCGSGSSAETSAIVGRWWACPASHGGPAAPVAYWTLARPRSSSAGTAPRAPAAARRPPRPRAMRSRSGAGGGALMPSVLAARRAPRSAPRRRASRGVRELEARVPLDHALQVRRALRQQHRATLAVLHQLDELRVAHDLGI